MSRLCIKWCHNYGLHDLLWRVLIHVLRVRHEGTAVGGRTLIISLTVLTFGLQVAHPQILEASAAMLPT